MKGTGYVHPFTDFGFKKIFGEEHSLVSLRAFLNTLLPEEHQIETLAFHKNEFSGRTVRERRAIYDLYCKSSDGVSFIVELQKQKQTYFRDRTLYYSTFPIQEQAQKGQWNFKLDPVYCIGVLDFRFDENQTEKVVHRVCLREDDDARAVFTDKLNFIFLEIPNFDLELEECHTNQEKWLYALKHMHTLEDVPEEFESVEGLPEAFEHAAMPMMSGRDFAAYQDSLKVYRDIHNIINTAIEEGQEKKRAEIEKTQAELKEAKAQVEEAKAQVEEAEAQVEEAEAEVEEVKAQVQQAEAQTEQAEARAEQAEVKAEQAQAQLEQGLSNALAKLMVSGMSELKARQLLGL